MQADSRSLTSSLTSVSVQQAITLLGSGLLAYPANTALQERLRSGILSVQDYYAQVLRFIYRLIVLFAAEDRGILFHPAADQTALERYAARYSTARLRRRAQRGWQGGTKRSNLYRDLWFVMEKLSSGVDCVELGLRSLHGLDFSGAAMPDLDGCEMTNRELLKAVRVLTFTSKDTTSCAVEYKNLGAVELGGIYESLLEMRPRIDLDAATLELTFASGNARKTSGSYYTPGNLIDCLLDAALEPALAEASARPDPQQAILDLKVCDLACGSGLFLIAAAYRIATHLVAVRNGGETPVREASCADLRDVVSRCIYGVDLNPMAVELCRFNLWLETAGSDRSLAAGDLHILCGNSLLGATPTGIHVVPGTDSSPARNDRRESSGIVQLTPGGVTSSSSVQTVPNGALQDQIFSWHEAFPTVFRLPVDGEQPDDVQADWKGGFDVVLGNPPYIFGENLPQEIKQVFPSIFALARGQYDTYWLFIEQSLKLVHARGRYALVVPDTLLARDETRAVRELLLQAGLERLYYCGTAFKAHVSTIIFAVAKGSTASEILYEEIDGSRGDAPVRSTCSKARFLADPRRRFLTHLADEEALMLARVESHCEPLRNLVKISRGEELGKKGVLSQGPIPIVVGEDIARYVVKPPTRFLETVKKDAWRYAAPRIIMLKTGYRCVAALDTMGYVTMQSVYTLHIMRPDIAYETLLALLNSRFVCWFVYKIFTSYKGLFPQLNQSTIQAIPVPRNLSSRQDELVTLVQEMLSLKKATMGENVDGERIEEVDREIDRVIYALYGISEAEIALVEQSLR